MPSAEGETHSTSGPKRHWPLKSIVAWTPNPAWLGMGYTSLEKGDGPLSA